MNWTRELTLKGIHSRLPTLAKSSASTGSSEQISQGKGAVHETDVKWCSILVWTEQKKNEI